MTGHDPQPYRAPIAPDGEPCYWCDPEHGPCRIHAPTWPDPSPCAPGCNSIHWRPATWPPSSAELASFRQRIAADWHRDAERYTGDPRAVRLYIFDAMTPRQRASQHERDAGIGAQDQRPVYMTGPDSEREAGAWWSFALRQSAAGR